MEFTPEKKINTENTENTENTCCSKTFNKILIYKFLKFLSFPLSYLVVQFFAFKLYHMFCMNSFIHQLLYSHSPLCLGFLKIMSYSYSK